MPNSPQKVPLCRSLLWKLRLRSERNAVAAEENARAGFPPAGYCSAHLGAEPEVADVGVPRLAFGAG
jgi:hypothetical protein